MFDWLTKSEWIQNFLKVKWEGIKGLSQTFIFAVMISMNSNSFLHKTLERRWHDFFHLFKWQGVLEIFEFHLRIFQILKLYATQWFSRAKIKWLLQNIWNMSWEFQRIKFKVLLGIIFNLELFGFYWNYFSPKIKYMTNRVTWFPTIEIGREINLNSFWYFLNDFCWILIEQ